MFNTDTIILQIFLTHSKLNLRMRSPGMLRASCTSSPTSGHQLPGPLAWCPLQGSWLPFLAQGTTLTHSRRFLMQLVSKWHLLETY